MLGFNLGWSFLKSSSNKVAASKVEEVDSIENITKDDFYISKDDLYGSTDTSDFSTASTGSTVAVSTEGSYFSSDDMTVKNRGNDLSHCLDELQISLANESMRRKSSHRRLTSLTNNSGSISNSTNSSPFSPQKGVGLTLGNNSFSTPVSRKRCSGSLKLTPLVTETSPGGNLAVNVVYSSGRGSGRENCKYLFERDSGDDAYSADESETDTKCEPGSPVCLGVRSIRKFKRMKVHPSASASTSTSDAATLLLPVFECCSSIVDRRHLSSAATATAPGAATATAPGAATGSSDEDEDDELITVFSGFSRPEVTGTRVGAEPVTLTDDLYLEDPELSQIVYESGSECMDSQRVDGRVNCKFLFEMEQNVRIGGLYVANEASCAHLFPYMTTNLA